MAAKTTIKVATLSAAAKDDALSITTLGGLIPVLANDPGGATLYGVYKNAGTMVNGQTPETQVSKATTATTAMGGTVKINANGTLTYTPPASAGLNQAALTALPAGAVYFTDTFSYVAKMGNDGALSLANVTFSIVGVNDLPTISGLGTGTAVENGPAATGALTVVDPDTGESSMQASTQNGAYGQLIMGTSGAWSYTLGATQDALNQGESHTETFTVKSFDGTNSTITVTVLGINDAPVANDGAGSATEGGAVITGAVTSTDADAYHTAAYSLPGAAPAGLTFNADGTWSFDPTNGAYDSLAAGETATLTVPYTVTDDKGATDTGDLVITITGTNDAPVAQAGSGEVDEDSSTSGQLSASDVDHDTTLSYATDSEQDGLTLNADGSWSFDASGEEFQSLSVGQSTEVEISYTVDDGDGGSDTETLTITVNGVNDAPTTGGVEDEVDEGDSIEGYLYADDVDDIHTLTFTLNNAAPAGMELDEDGEYTFDASDDAYDSLADGESMVLTMPFTVTDDQGATDTDTLKITVYGTNDAPVADAATADVDEDSSTSGQLTGSDVDHGTVLSFSTSSNADGLDLESDGSWTFDASGDDYQSLAVGQSMLVTVPYTVSDGDGGSDDSTLKITVMGVNDNPDTSDKNFTVYEDATATGAVTATDVDDGDSWTFALDGAAPAGLEFNDDGTYSFDASDASYQSLGAGDSVSMSVGFTVTDENGGTDTGTLYITVKGVNDEATVTGAAKTMIEDTPPYLVSGDLDVTDPDAGQSVFATVPGAALTGAYGTFTFDSATGNWTYTLNNSSAAVQGLVTGQSVVDSLAVSSVDGTGGASIDITIKGQDEVAVVVNLVTTFMVNHGQTWINGRTEFTGFDSNDKLGHSNAYDYQSYSYVDTDGNGSLDSTKVIFKDTSEHPAELVSVYLLGYTGFTTAQLA